MKEIIKYIADDGTEFDDDVECLHYETNLKLNSAEDVVLFDSQLTEILESERIFDAFVIHCRTDRAEKVLSTVCELTGANEPWLCSDNRTPVPRPAKGVTYIYVSDDDGWTTLDQMESQCNELYRKINDIRLVLLKSWDI